MPLSATPPSAALPHSIPASTSNRQSSVFAFSSPHKKLQSSTPIQRAGDIMTDWERMLVELAIDAAKNCIHIFEAAYPVDERPRKALEAAEQWLKEPTAQNKQMVEQLETP